METVLILSADKWNVTDERTGKAMEGVTVHYINEYREDTDSAVGFKPIKIAASESIFEEVRRYGAPALYQIDFRSRPGPKGVPTLTLVKAVFAKEMHVFAVE